MVEQKSVDPINHKAWARNMLAFIRSHDLESSFADWCGGWAYPVAAEPVPRPSVVEALKVFRDYGCPVCSGDCGSANPPVIGCPMQMAEAAIREAAKARGHD